MFPTHTYIYIQAAQRRRVRMCTQILSLWQTILNLQRANHDSPPHVHRAPKQRPPILQLPMQEDQRGAGGMCMLEDTTCNISPITCRSTSPPSKSLMHQQSLLDASMMSIPEVPDSPCCMRGSSGNKGGGNEVGGETRGSAEVTNISASILSTPFGGDSHYDLLLTPRSKLKKVVYCK